MPSTKQDLLDQASLWSSDEGPSDELSRVSEPRVSVDSPPPISAEEIPAHATLTTDMTGGSQLAGRDFITRLTPSPVSSLDPQPSSNTEVTPQEHVRTYTVESSRLGDDRDARPSFDDIDAAIDWAWHDSVVGADLTEQAHQELTTLRVAGLARHITDAAYPVQTTDSLTSTGEATANQELETLAPGTATQQGGHKTLSGHVSKISADRQTTNRSFQARHDAGQASHEPTLSKSKIRILQTDEGVNEGWSAGATEEQLHDELGQTSWFEDPGSRRPSDPHDKPQLDLSLSRPRHTSTPEPFFVTNTLPLEESLDLPSDAGGRRQRAATRNSIRTSVKRWVQSQCGLLGSAYSDSETSTSDA